MKATKLSGFLILVGLGLVALPHAAGATSTSEVNDQLTEMQFQFYTGGDDKRSDSRVWVVVNLARGGAVVREAVGDDDGWGSDTWSEITTIALPAGTTFGDVLSVEILWKQGGGGWNGDNWNLNELNVWMFDQTRGQWGFNALEGNPLKRFTGSATSFSWPWLWPVL